MSDRAPVFSVRDFCNRVAFAVRSRAPWGRSYREKGGAQLELIPQRWKDLASRYGLDRLGEKLDARSFLLNLAKLEQMETLASQAGLALPARPIRVLDIGSQSFVYAPALSLFFSRWGTQRPRTVELTGIEIDANRRRWSLHTRRDLARYYASLVPWTVYQAGDFLEAPFPHRFDAVTWFRPHLAVEPLLAAGLPRRLHRPELQMRRAFELLEPHGALFFSFQSQAEGEMAGEILAKQGRAGAEMQKWSPPDGAVEGRAQWLQILGKA